MKMTEADLMKLHPCADGLKANYSGQCGAAVAASPGVGQDERQGQAILFWLAQALRSIRHPSAVSPVSEQTPGAAVPAWADFHAKCPVIASILMGGAQ